MEQPDSPMQSHEEADKKDNGISNQLKEDLETAKKERAPPEKQGKIIVRNLGFDLREKHLKACFGKFGTIVDSSVPLKAATNTNRGFGFVEFATRQEAVAAIAAMNGQKFKGRPLSVELSVTKASYEKRITTLMEHTNMDKKEAIKPKSIKWEEKKEKERLREEEQKKKEKEAEPKTKTQERKDLKEKKKEVQAEKDKKERVE